ncbi:ATP-dependent helicase [candidate division KSB1 bacterium]|nr:ATP-dependent helicase [candidate division KSB1 bacterium]
MKLTEAQRNAVKYDGHTFITACPGSGKTRTLIAKLLRGVDEVRGTSRRIACITYTNAGVYEIEKRLRAYGKTGDDDYCDISTIHAFCLNNILHYFYWRLPAYKSGFTILPSDSDRYREIVTDICNDYGLKTKDHERFEQLNRQPDGTPIVSEPLTLEIAFKFWERLQLEGFIDFTNIIYYSYRLMVDWPAITHTLACRFAWFLVDEFQDTSALQVEILRFIAGCSRSKFFLVGDPYQSIFGFAGAKPGLMEEFVNEIGAERGFKLLTNFRSSERIIAQAERLCPRNPAMTAGGDAIHFTEIPRYIHATTAFEAITDYFIPIIDELGINYGETAILAPWWIKLLNLGRQLRNYGIPIIGPGARPYKRKHLFALLAEQICAYIEHPQPDMIPQIERELFMLLNNVTGSLNFKVYTYKGRTTVYRLIRKGNDLRIKYTSGVEWLEHAVQEFSNILYTNEFLPSSAIHLLSESVDDMLKDMVKNKVDIENLTVSDLGLFASTKNNMRLRTIHRAKGLEFDAVAIIDLHDGRIPDFRAVTQEQFAESRRLLYVAMTRARRVLMYITDAENWRNVPSPYLSNDVLGLID